MNRLLLSLLLVFSPLFFTKAYCQTFLQINSEMQSILTSCQGNVKYQISIQNLSPFEISDINLEMNLPVGINYFVGSATNGVIETDISNLGSVDFELPIISIGSNFTFQVSLSAGCMNLPSSLSNNLAINFQGNNFTGGMITGSQIHNSPVYNVTTPNLSIVNISNQTINGSVGQIFERCISITNGGNGGVSEFSLMHTHGAGINVNSSSAGVITSMQNGTFYTLDSNDFVSLGNANGILDPGETVIICETIEIVQCSNAQSSYLYEWGCSGEACQSISATSNIVFNAETPNIQITRNVSFASVSGSGSSTSVFDGLQNNCYGNNINGDFESWIVVTNNGSGNAVSTMIEIGQGWNGLTQFMASDYYSSLNTSSFTIQRNGGVVQSLPLINTTLSNSKPCLPSNPVGAVLFEIPLIVPGDTIIVRWNHFTCASNYCENNNRRHLLHWRLKGTYKNNCDQQFIIPITQTIPGTPGAFYFRNGLSLDSSPGTMLGTSAGQVKFLIENGEFSALPFNSANDKYVYQVILPTNCLSIDPSSFELRNASNVLQPLPNSIVTIGDTMNFIYNFPLTGPQWTLKFDVNLNCVSCTNQGVKTIKLRTLFYPNLNCNTEMVVGCSSASIQVFCPPVCEGLNLLSTEIRRINYGIPDNDNNGIPDLTGTHDLTKIRTDRVMYGDTIEVKNIGFVQNTANLAMNHIILNQSIAQAGNRMTYHSSAIRIRDASTGLSYNCPNLLLSPTITTSGTTRTWVFDIPITSLSMCLPVGFSLQTGDSIFVISNFSNTSNWGGNPILNVPVKNKLFLTTLPYSTSLPLSQLYGCNEYTKEFNLIGYFWTTYGPDDYVANNCGIVTVSQNYYLSIGQCCDNYAGGNLFPYEYRNWGNPDSLQIEFPDNYEFVSADFNFRRTTGTLMGATSPWFPMVPINVNLNKYSFNLGSFFGSQTSGNPILYGDDGWYGTVRVMVRPNCSIEDSTAGIVHRWFMDPVPQLENSSTSNIVSVVHDNITYKSPKLTLQSSQYSTNTAFGIEHWDLTVQNTSFISSASNFWIAAPTINNTFLGDSLMDLTTSIVYLPNTNGVFTLPNLASNSSRVYRLFTTSTSCSLDSIIVYSGWDCAGYPNSVSQFPCEPLKVKLLINPISPRLENTITVINSGLPDLCDTLELQCSVRNYQLGYAFDLATQIQMPEGLDYVGGSSVLTYNGSDFVIDDPVLSGGQSYIWNLVNSSILSDGLTGIANLDSNYFLIKFKAVSSCGFYSGDRIFGTSSCNSFCGSPHVSNTSFSSQIFLNDLVVPYTTELKFGIDFIVPCASSNELNITVFNRAGQTFGEYDSVKILLPIGVNYIAGSFNPIHNASITQNEPVIQSILGQQQLVWPMPYGIASNDSMTFSIFLSAVADQLPCDIIDIRGTTITKLNATCQTDMTQCDVGIVTGEAVKSLFVYKSDFNLLNPFSTFTIDADGNEFLTGSFDLVNVGASLSTLTPLDIRIYNDMDMNGILSGPDVLLTSETVNQDIAAGETYTYEFTNILAPLACKLIATLDVANNPCLCSTESISFLPELYGTNFFDTICSNESVLIGNPVSSTYQFNWSNHPNLSDQSIMQPTFWSENNTDIQTTILLLRSIENNNCVIVDTSFITINPQPLFFITGDTTVCRNSTSPVLTLIGANAVAPYTFIYNINGGELNYVVSTEDVATITVPTSDPGVFIYNIINVFDSSGILCPQFQSDSASIVVNDLPTASINGTTSICENASSALITLEGFNGTAPYTFTYNINGAANQTIVSTGTTATISAPTTTAGTFNYNLVSVQDASTTTCSQLQTGIATITVNPLPTASISGTTSVCRNGTSPVVTFTGANGTAPYTFTYNINGAANQTVVSTGATATISAPTTTVGTFNYSLVSVQDASTTTCSQLQTGIATITVNPLPTASISGTTSVCRNGTSPVVTFTGANSTAPYTFTYNINGAANQTVVSTGATATISAPTTAAGTFNYNLVSLQDASTTTCSQLQTGIATITVNPLPTAIISGTASVCHNGTSPVVTFTGANGTAPYTFTYNLDGGASQTVTSVGNSATVTIPTNVLGSFTYNLESVVDASGTLCSQVQVGSAVVVVNPLPAAVISGDATVCQNASTPLVTFTGSNATSPYTFSYNIDGGATQTVTSVGDFATVAAPTNVVGTFTYNLLSVVDASGTLCSQAQSGTAVIVINPLPLAVISGSTSICQDAVSPTVTFTGSNATAPYSFTYTINGGSAQTITSIGDVATITVPANNVGTYNYNLVSVVDASGTLCSNPQTGTATMIVNPLPLGNIYGAVEVCLNATEDTYVTMVGSNGTAPYTFAYTINGGTIQTVTSSGNTATVLIPTNVVGTFDYNLIGVTDASSTACSSVLDESIAIIVRPLPTAQIIGGDSLCLNTGNAVIEFVGATGLNPYTFSYTINGGTTQTISTVAGSNNVFLNVPSTSVGTFVYSLISVSESGLSCAQNQAGNVAIVIHPDPISSFTPSPNVILFSDNVSQMINTSVGATTYVWNFGDGDGSTVVSPYHQFEIEDQELFTITLTAISEFGCISSSVETITVKDDELIYVPNTFTPNGNELNNVFKPVIYSGIDVSSYTFEIYNRWGALLFMTKDPSNGWDGTFKGNVSQDGVYNWRIEYTTESKPNGKVLMGNINLLR